MEKLSNASPRFGITYLHNWLSRPVSNPEGELERRLALAVLTHGEHTRSIQAFRYSRDDWQLEHKGRTATLTFQNFANMNADQPLHFAAYTLNVAGLHGSNLLRGVHERTHHADSQIEQLTGEAKIEIHSPAALRRLDRLMKPLVNTQAREAALA